MSGEQLPRRPLALPAASHEGALSPATSVRDGSIALPDTPAAPVVPFDLHKTDLAFPPVRQPSYTPRRYTRRVGLTKSRPLFLYYVSPRVYCVFWIAVVILHLGCALFLGLTGGGYFYLLDTTLFGYLTLFGVSVDAFYLPPIGVGYFVACGLHAYSLATILFHSLRTHRSAFTSTQILTRTVTTPVMRIRRMSLTALSSIEFRTQSVLDRLPSPFIRACYRFWHSLTRAYDSTDVKNECFYANFAIRQIIASLLHIYQLYMASVYLPQPQLATLWVTLLVINCWLTPILSTLFRANKPRTRLICLSISLLLDVTACVAIPGAIDYKYASEFNFRQSNFAPTQWYQDKWMNRLVAEFRMLLVLTPLDFVTKVGIAVNAWRTLRVVPLILFKICPDEVVPEDPNAANDDPVQQSQRDQLSPVSSASSLSSLQSIVIVATSGRWSLRLLASLVLFAIGGAVLGIHVQAISTTDFDHCTVSMHTWFASKPTCSLIEYRCTQSSQSGSAVELDAILRQYEPTSITMLSIRHCTNVELPPSIKSLSNLLGIKIYNSTLAHWGDDAALTNFNHPGVRFVYLIDVQMSEFPRGLLSTNFPRHLSDIEICRTNLTALPDQLAVSWSHVTSLVFEEFPFASFPSVLLRLQPSSLSLANSRIDHLPPEIFANSNLYYLVLNGNPLRELPTDVVLCTKFYWLSILATNVSRLPDAYTFVIVDAHGSPLCETPPPALLLDCVVSSPFAMYPIDLEPVLND